MGKKLYLVVECNELGDQFECDADRIPICITDDYSEYNKAGYEIYETQDDGNLKLIREYNEVSETTIVVTVWNNDIRIPISVTTIQEGDRSSVTKSLVEKIKNQYGFPDTVTEIFEDIQASGAYGEEINGSYVTFGEKYDDCINAGY